MTKIENCRKKANGKKLNRNWKRIISHLSKCGWCRRVSALRKWSNRVAVPEFYHPKKNSNSINCLIFVVFFLKEKNGKPYDERHRQSTFHFHSTFKKQQQQQRTELRRQKRSDRLNLTLFFNVSVHYECPAMHIFISFHFGFRFVLFQPHTNK